MEISISSATMENSYGSFLKLKELLYDQEIQLLGIYPKEIKQDIECLMPHVLCSIIHNSQDIEKSKCPSMDEWNK